MLAKAVVHGYGERAEFVEETFSESALAKKFGIKFYPAIFVNEVLIAKPSDFFGNTTGRYIPWRDPKNQEKFRADLTRMIDIALRDEAALAREGVAPDTGSSTSVGELPDFSLKTLDGGTLDRKTLLGKVSVVEFWAEWCPPCRSTLAFLAETHKKRDDVQIAGIAIESDEENIKVIARQMNLAYPIAMATTQVTQAFGDVVAVPTLFVFDKAGKLANVFYGAPPDLHEQIGNAITASAAK